MRPEIKIRVGHLNIDIPWRNLAIKYGKDSLVWDGGVDYFVLNLSKPKYYNDPVVDFGYARGYEPYEYVQDIFERYKNYKTFADQ